MLLLLQLDDTEIIVRTFGRTVLIALDSNFGSARRKSNIVIEKVKNKTRLLGL